MTRYRIVLATPGGMSHDALSFTALMGNLHWNRDTHQYKTINSFTAIGAYMHQLIKRASLLVYNFSEFCLLTTFDS